MKHILICFTAIALISTLILGCRKEQAEQTPSEVIYMEETDTPAAVVSRGETYGCSESIQGEPTYVQGEYHYDPITLVMDDDFREVTISYNALTVKNRFKIVSPSGYVYFNSGYVSGTGSYYGCIETNSQLLVSAKSTPNALDRWSVSISACPLSCL